MPFQFYCPYGHLLTGEAAQSGQACQCPLCGVTFIIPPAPVVQPAVPSSSPTAPAGFMQPAVAAGYPSPQPAPVSEPAPSVHLQPGHAAEADQIPAQQPSPEPAAPEPPPEEELIHIPCPNGHELETPKDMVGQDVMCPHCQVQFRLRYQDSVEYKEQRRKEREYRDNLWAKRALQWAIVAAVLVVLSIVGLIIVRVMDK